MHRTLILLGLALRAATLNAGGFHFGIVDAVRASALELRAQLTLSAVPTLPIAPASTASNTPSITPSPADTSTSTRTVTLTETFSATPTVTDVQTVTPSWTSTGSSTSTSTLSPTPSRTLTSTGTWTSTSTPTSTVTRTSTATPSPTSSRTATPTPSVTPSPTATRTSTATPLPTVITVVGTGTSGLGTDNVIGTSSACNYPYAMTTTQFSSLVYYTDKNSNQVRVYNPTGSSIYDAYFSRRTVTAGAVRDFMGDTVTGAAGSSLTTTPVLLNNPRGLVYSSYQRAMFLADSSNHRVLWIVENYPSAPAFQVFLGGNGAGSTGDGASTTSAKLTSPFAVAVDDLQGFLYVTDTNNNRVRKVDLNFNTPYTITAFAGISTTQGYAGDNVSATDASVRFRTPRGLAVHSNGDLYIADTGNHCIRRVRSGTLTTVAGVGGVAGSDDNAIGTLAHFDNPENLLIEGDILYVSDTTLGLVRKVDIADNYRVTTFAGGGATYGPGATPLNSALVFLQGILRLGSATYLAQDSYISKIPY